MAHHKSSKKRIKQNAKQRALNRFSKRSARTAIKALREMTDKEAAQSFLPKIVSMIDKLAKKNTWHPNKAANLKSSLSNQVNQL